MARGHEEEWAGECPPRGSAPARGGLLTPVPTVLGLVGWDGEGFLGR